jgi:clan AA aspartic protease
VIGTEDDHNRALIDIEVRRTRDSQVSRVTAWIDTAFDGHLVFPKSLIEELGLESLVETEAILADGRRVTLETFICYLDWFGEVIPLQVIANEGKLPLLGTGLLEKHVLHIDYATKQLTLE